MIEKHKTSRNNHTSIHRRLLHLLPILAALAAVTFLFLISSGSARADNDPPPSGGHVEGDWTVTDTRTYTSCTITLHGNLIIQGSLIFNNVILLIQSDEQDTFSIDITGSFNVNDLDNDPETAGDATVISPGELEFTFNMQIATQAAVDMRNSIMRHYDDITVLSSNVNFIDNTFTDLRGSGIDIIGCVPTFSGNNLSYDARSGNAFVFDGCTGLMFEDNRIDGPWFHVIADGCEGITFRNNIFLDGDRGIVVHGTTAIIEDNYFQWNGKTVVVEEGTAIVRRNTFYQNAAALATDEFTQNDVEAYDNHIEECGEAFLLPGPVSESTARIHDNTILNCWGAVGVFTAMTARIYDNHIEGCTMALYTTGSESEFYGNTIINGSYVFYSRHGSVIEASNNLISNNMLVAYITEGSQLLLENNAIRFNLMGIHTYERNSGNARVTMSGNDVYDNPLFAIWNVDENAHVEAENNWWGGKPNEYGDRIIGPNIDYEPYSVMPNDPVTPVNPFTPYIVIGKETYRGTMNARGPWIVRDGGNLTLEDVDFDLKGYFIGVKNGGALTANGTIRNGSTVALSSDLIRLFDTTISDMGANILTFFGSPELDNVSLTAPLGGMPKEMVTKCLIWAAMSDPLIEDCVFNTTDDTYDIFFDRSSGTVSNCTFSSGKGIEVLYGNATIDNCIFNANATGIVATDGSIALSGNYLDSISVDITGSNVTIASNSVVNSTLHLDSGVSGTLTGNLLRRSSVVLLYSDLGMDRNRFDATDLRLTGSDISFCNNTVENGSRLSLSGIRGIISNNTFRDGDPAISITRGSVHINYNNFLGNNVALSNTGSNRVNAVYNHWNSDDGPAGDGPGSGDPIYGDLLYEPWALSPIEEEGAVLNFAPQVSIDGVNGTVRNSLLLSGWAWDPDGDSITVELRITESNYDTGWIQPLTFERYPGWTRWYHLWDVHALDAGTYVASVRVSDGLLTTEAQDPVTISLGSTSHTVHSQIQIYSDAALLLPTSGVTGGSGTESDPYVISGWEIRPGIGALSVPGIDIRNVQSHVVIEDCFFTGGSDDSWYVFITYSPHVSTVRNCIFDRSGGGGIYALNDFGTPVSIEISDNLFIEIDSFCVHLINYTFRAMRNHVVGDGSSEGPFFVSSYLASEDALARDNVFYHTDYGFRFDGIDAELFGNIFLGGGNMVGTYMSDLRVHDNLFAGNWNGFIFNGDVPRIENNTFIENDGISLYNGQNQGLSAIFRNNTFRNNPNGLSNTYGGYTDARYNYWGAPDGPSGEGPGSGDPVDEDTIYDPWYTEGPEGNNHPPRIMFIEPWGGDDIAREEIELVWYAADPDGDDITVNLSYSR
ncbi:MAG: right-handed parallel beta-helix repeat-containing protein, partial [Thermoplasmata archaeon]|nr:right-handed parallel beta-helix repeat-containing protein [Thermoplasmata archaeon]